MKYKALVVFCITLFCVSSGFSKRAYGISIPVNNSYFEGIYPYGWHESYHAQTTCLGFDGDTPCFTGAEGWNYVGQVGGNPAVNLIQYLGQNYSQGTYTFQLIWECFGEHEGAPNSRNRFQIFENISDPADWDSPDVYDYVIGTSLFTDGCVGQGQEIDSTATLNLGAGINFSMVMIQSWMVDNGESRNIKEFNLYNGSSGYWLNITSPTDDETYSLAAIPLTVVSDRASSYMQYRLNTWGPSSWNYMTSMSDDGGTYTYSTQLYYLDEGDYTITVRDDYNNTEQVSFTLDLLDTPTNVKIEENQEDYAGFSTSEQYVCMWDRMSIEAGYTGQVYISEIWINNDLNQVLWTPGNVLTDPLPFDIQVQSGRTGAGFNIKNLNESAQYNLIECRVTQVQRLIVDDIEEEVAYSNYGYNSIVLFNPYIKVYHEGVELPQGYNVVDVSSDTNITVTFNSESPDPFYIKHTNTDFEEWHSLTLIEHGSVSYNVSLNPGQNYLTFYRFDGLKQNEWWRINAYDSSSIDNVTLRDNFDNVLCDMDTCNDYQLYSRGKIVTEMSDSDKDLFIEVYAKTGNNYSVIYENDVNCANDFDLNDSTLTLYVNEEFGEGDEELELWLLDHPDIFDLNEVEFCKRLNFNYIADSNNPLLIYTPANEEIIAFVRYGSQTKNVTFIPSYSLYDALRFSDIGIQAKSGCRLDLDQDGLDLFFDRLNFYSCLVNDYVTNQVTAMTYIFGSIALIVLGNTLLTIFRQK